MEFRKLVEAFAARCGIPGMDAADGSAALLADGIRVELLDDAPARRILACAEIGLPPPTPTGRSAP